MTRKSVAMAIAFLFVILALPIAADEPAPKTTASLQSSIVSELDDVEKKIVALAEAVPQEKFAWRPAEGVRSVSEAFMHVAQGNYFLATFGGTPPPQGLDLMKYDKAFTDKKEVVAAIHASYDHARKFVNGVSEADLAKEVDFFGKKKSLREILLLTLEHSHEHLGQTIAYARMNGVKPPWSE